MTPDPTRESAVAPDKPTPPGEEPVDDTAKPTKREEDEAPDKPATTE